MTHAGELCALGTAASWSVGANLFAAAGRRMGSLTLNRLRIVTAAVLLGVTLLVLRGSPWPVWATRPQLALLAVSGLIGFAFGDLYYFRALVILGPGRAALIASVSPIFTALIAWPVLHEHPGPYALLGMALTIGGVAWVLMEREHARHEHVEGSVAVGIVAGVLAALGQSGGYVLSKLALRTGIDPLSATVIRVVAAAVILWIAAAAGGQARPTLRAMAERRSAAMVVGGAFCGPFLGVTLSLVALRFIEAGVAATLTSIHPLLAMLIAARFHGERLTLRTLAGAVIAIAGVIVLFHR